MDWGTLILDLFLTALFYLLVPAIFCIRKKPMTEKQIKRVVIINGAIVWLLMAIITGNPTMAVLFWSTIGYIIMKRVLLSDTKAENLIYECQYCGYQQKVDFELCPKCGKNTNSDAYENVEQKQETSHNTSETEIPQNQSVSQEKRKYCSQCGGLINSETKICEGCGKQYFKGFSFKKIIPIILSVLLVLLVVVSVILYIQNTKLNDEIETLKNQNDSGFELWYYKRFFNFFDERAVLVSNDGTNKYHKYGCSLFDDSEYWIFNTEYAEWQGYQACSHCCE